MKMKRNVMKEKKLERVYALPLLLVLAIIPLITLIAIYQTDIGDNAWISGNAFYDFFLYYKAHLLMMVGLVLGIVIAISLLLGYQGNLHGRNSYLTLIPVGVFALLAFVSAIASEHRTDALFGGYEQFEGLFVLLTYVFCFVFAYVYVTDEKWVNLLLYTLLIGSLILSFLGAMQAFGKDYMTNKAMLPILTMFMKNVPDGFSISASFGEGVSYATLYNPNYVGTYVALVLPVTIALGLWGRKVIFMVIAGVSALCQIIMLFGAQSMTGLIGVAGAVLVAIIFLFSDMRKNRRILGCVGGTMALAVVVLLLWKPDLLSRFTETAISSCNYTVSNIQTTKDSFVISLDNKNVIQGKLQETGTIYQYELQDSAGKRLETAGDLTNGITICEDGYQGISFFAAKRQVKEGDANKEYDVLRISAGDTCYWDLTKKDNSLYYINGIGKLDQLRKVESWGFEHRYDLATNRGYIWSRTLPLLKDTLLLGKGADNFVYAFPNDDYVGKVSCGFGSQTVTKPHNMYMQIWVQNGMLACLAFLALYILFAIQTFRRCFQKGKTSYAQKMQIAIFCGSTGYMVAGVANDSTICVAPIFWVLLGIGYALNKINEKN